VHQNIGVCTQHDILWDTLTIEEHLVFYARIKGVSAMHESHQVSALLHQVGLYFAKDRLISQLSGGMKRRLSLAIALSGNSKVVFSDEPTTGDDIWAPFSMCMYT